MTDRKDGQEPSMEEILSSIRRIIADEKDGPDAKEGPGGAESVGPPRTQPRVGTAARTVEPEEDELELTELVDEPARAPTPPPRPAAAPLATESQLPERASMPPAPDESLVSPATAQASTAALARLTRAVAPEERPVAPTSGRTIEELVIELLRPQLKEWLDQNLAPLVERVVEQEIKKLARRAELL